MKKTSGRVIVCGMGKSGIIGRKISATLASTGTPSFFMHPGEAFHGDLGMVSPEDIFLALSNSGETEEVLRLLPFLRENGNILISMTGNKASTLAKESTYHINVSVEKIDRKKCDDFTTERNRLPLMSAIQRFGVEIRMVHTPY